MGTGRRRDSLRSVANSAIVLLLLLSFTQHSCVTSYLVSGNSMMPTYADGDRVIVARIPTFLGDPERGSTVIAKVQGEILIKRVIGLPGETIDMDHGILIGDGQYLQDPTPPDYRDSHEMATVRLGPDEYFLLGDHRRVSIDSRDFGPIRRNSILGQVVYHFSSSNVPQATEAAEADSR